MHYTRICDVLKQIPRRQWLIHGDETTVQVPKEPGRKEQIRHICRYTGALWTASSRLGCSSISRGSMRNIRAVSTGDYSGTLVTDGWVRGALSRQRQTGCLAHLRRLFTDALKGQKNKPSSSITKAIKYFQAQYQVDALAQQTADFSDLLPFNYANRQTEATNTDVATMMNVHVRTLRGYLAKNCDPNLD
ncbi:IS66 family transposase [Burkholderia ubonensis]|uniref:IS66 family transposase n=1 Tax=Burkholderia ubonensis TaxID=101571 RepID=UPI0009B3FCD7|nr:transposase [Burkholderia ubonensis]